VDWWHGGLRYSKTKTVSAPLSSPQVLHRLARDRSWTSAKNCCLSSFIATQNGTNSYQCTSKALNQTHMPSTFTACHRLDLHTRTLFSCYLLHVSTKTQPFSGNPTSMTYLIRTLFAVPYLRSSAVLRGHAAYIGGYRRFGTNYRSRLQGVTRKMGPIGCTETSVRNYHYSLRNIPEGRSYRQQF
jgi:hypothetical protein